jgi:hypothetical protein
MISSVILQTSVFVVAVFGHMRRDWTLTGWGFWLRDWMLHSTWQTWRVSTGIVHRRLAYRLSRFRKQRRWVRVLVNEGGSNSKYPSPLSGCKITDQTGSWLIRTIQELGIIVGSWQGRFLILYTSMAMKPLNCTQCQCPGLVPFSMSLVKLGQKLSKCCCPPWCTWTYMFELPCYLESQHPNISCNTIVVILMSGFVNRSLVIINLANTDALVLPGAQDCSICCKLCLECWFISIAPGVVRQALSNHHTASATWYAECQGIMGVWKHF